MPKRPSKDGVVTEKIQRTLLIDGSALFKVGYYGAKTEYNHHGQHIGGIYQFLTVLRKLLNEELYHRVYVFWDGKFSGRLRFNHYAMYKSDRGKDYINGTQPVDESEVLQKHKIWNYLEDLCIRQVRNDVVEGDDFIAYYCLNAEDYEEITICTNDRDMCQLISDNVRIYFCDLKEYINLENYNTHFKHHQSNAMLIKMVCGDTADSIMGIKGVKETTLLNNFPELAERPVTLEQIITKAKLIQEERAKTKLKPLKALDNIINCVTDGIQGTKLYEINEILVNLKKPLMNEEAIEELNNLKDGYFDTEERSIKDVFKQLKIDGIDRLMSDIRYSEYLLPFKKLIEREQREYKTI